MKRISKKSKAFIITFIAVFLLLILGYFIIKNSDTLFRTDGETSQRSFFSLLTGERQRDVEPVDYTDDTPIEEPEEPVIEEPVIEVPTTPGQETPGRGVGLEFKPLPLPVINVGTFTPQCRDGVDNDGDGFVDERDPGCHSDLDVNNDNSYTPDKTFEGDFTSQCNDSEDNDEDGLTDVNDPGCHWDLDANNSASYDPYGGFEFNLTPQCSDGRDNDADKLVDTNDPGCHWDLDANNSASYDPYYGNEINTALPPPDTGSGQCIDPELQFTPAEQAQLDELTRQFYRLAFKLKSENDLFAEIEAGKSYVDLANDAKELTNQCYAETGTTIYTSRAGLSESLPDVMKDFTRPDITIAGINIPRTTKERFKVTNYGLLNQGRYERKLTPYWNGWPNGINPYNNVSSNVNVTIAPSVINPTGIVAATNLGLPGLFIDPNSLPLGVIVNGLPITTTGQTTGISIFNLFPQYRGSTTQSFFNIGYEPQVFNVAGQMGTDWKWADFEYRWYVW
jgi:hypothetical protein